LVWFLWSLTNLPKLLMDSPKDLEEITWTYVAILAGYQSGLILYRKAIGVLSGTR
jgi:hypothetical protein